MPPTSGLRPALNSPKFNFLGAVVGVIAEVVGWLSNLPERYPYTAHVGFGLTVFFLGRLAYTQWKEADRLRAAAVPRLTLTWDKGQLYDSLHNDGRLRIFRVGVLNSGDPVHNVAVKLSMVEPELPRVFPMQELQETHKDPGVSRFTLNKSEEPLVFVDLIYQDIYLADTIASGTIYGEDWKRPYKAGEISGMRFQFADGARDFKPPNAHPLERYQDQYLIWLAIDGNGAEAPRKFVLRRNARGQYDLSLAFP